MTYREDSESLFARYKAIETELSLGRSSNDAALRRERDDVARRLAAQRRLPMLANVRVAQKCNARWQEMIGDEQRRYCTHCERHVYNLSAMTAGQAESLLRDTNGQICKRIFRRADGTVLTADCPVGSATARRETVRLAVVAAVATATALAGAASLDDTPVTHKPALEVEMGL
jgi:hypothetical protein